MLKQVVNWRQLFKTMYLFNFTTSMDLTIMQNSIDFLYI